MIKTNIKAKRKIVKALKEYARKNTEEQIIKKTYKFTSHSANSWLLGVMFDRGIPYEKAWGAGEYINKLLGNPSDSSIVWKTFIKMGEKKLNQFLRYGDNGKAFHRFYRTFARLLPIAAKIILDNYGGDSRKLWHNQMDVKFVRKRFEEIPGIGPALSRMAVLTLARDCGLLGGNDALSQLDIKPDVHVMKVFQRTGLIEQDDTIQDAIRVAQEMSPDFPGELDIAFDIGRKWCKKTKPDCSGCEIGKECPKIVG